MKILKYIWNILINLAELLIIIGILNYVNYGFESLVMSILILIYITIDFHIRSNGFVEIKKLIGFTGEFVNLKILLKDPKLLQYYDNEEDIYSDSLDNSKKTLEAITPKFYVCLVSNFIFYIICILNILKVILN